MANLYTISIAGPDSGNIIATATVEIVGDNAKITEIRTEASAAHSIPPQLSSIDFPLLVRAASILSDTRKREPQSDAEPEAEISKPRPHEPEPAPLPTKSEPQTTTVPVEDQLPGSAGRPGKSDMPSDFGVNYWRLGSIQKVAKHYDVPHSIAKDWIKALQRDGKITNPWPKKRIRPNQ